MIRTATISVYQSFNDDEQYDFAVDTDGQLVQVISAYAYPLPPSSTAFVLGHVSAAVWGVYDGQFARWQRDNSLYDCGRILVDERVDIQPARLCLKYCMPTRAPVVFFKVRHVIDPDLGQFPTLKFNAHITMRVLE